MQLLNCFWNQLSFDDIPVESQLRIKELLLILNSLNYDLHKLNRSLVINKELEVREWVEELISLVSLEQSNNLTGKVLIQQAKAIMSGDKINILLSLEASAKILELIEQYQKSANPLQWTNFGSQIYLECNLSRKIELLYQIGHIASIISPNETFDSYTRVDEVTQKICNEVCSWIENNLGLTINYINVYEPFIHNYKRFVFERSETLKEIGTRSGILSEELLENKQRISVADARLVLDWIYVNFKIELPFPEEYKPEPGLINKASHNWFYNLIGIICLLILIVIPLSPMSFNLYQQLVEQSALNPDKPLPKQKIKKQAIPLKPVQ